MIKEPKPVKPVAGQVFFFSRPDSPIPSPYYPSIAAMLHAPGFSPKCHIWTGSHNAPIPVMCEDSI